MKNKRAFITGIPASGKTYLAKRAALELGAVHVRVDDTREDLRENPEYKKWVDFYFSQDEKTYYTATNYEEQWKNLVAQSEAIWPGILEQIKVFDNETRPVIFEGVNILPHLAARDLGFPGVVLIGHSYNEVLERIKEDPRWGETEELQKLEADVFFNGERPRYKSEGEKYGYKVFETADEAREAFLGLFSK